MTDGGAMAYVFNMDGQNERTFTWVVQTEEVNIPAEANKSSLLKAKMMKKDAAVAKQQTIRKKAETFDLSTPPMIK